MRIAVYAGSFDPITKGHMSVVKRAADIFDKVIVLIATNPNKRSTFSPRERMYLIENECCGLTNVSIEKTEGYVAHFAAKAGATFLIRGIRGITDIDDEMRLANANRILAPKVQTIFLPAEKALAAVSSSELKNRIRQGKSVNSYCSEVIASALRQRLQKGRFDEKQL